MSHYRPDLAFIHDDGFGHLASAGAAVLIDALHRRGLTAGTILDLRCGGGITARMLTDRGFSVARVDLSKSLIEMARQKVPEATFHVGSFVEMDVAPCVAICAIVVQAGA